MKLELQHQYLADENERDEAKAYFLDKFREGSTKSLEIIVGPYKGSKNEEETKQYLNHKIGISSSSTSESGWLSKKRTSKYTTNPIKITQETMEDLSNIFYDIILAFDVRVEINESA